MSLFFEDEIEKMKNQANSSELLEILSQDPRGSDELSLGNKPSPLSKRTQRSDNLKVHRW